MPPQSTPSPPPGAPVAQVPGAQTTGVAPTATAAPLSPLDAYRVYQGLREKREILWNQKSRLESEREELVQKIRQGPASDADRAGLEQQLAGVDQRIAKASIDIAEADGEVAAAAAVPGAIERPHDPNEVAEEQFGMTLVLLGVLLFPVAIGFARRLWKRASVVSAVPPELVDRVGNIERNLDTVALEIERIGEGQRFVNQLLASRQEPAREAIKGPDRG